MLNIVAKVDVRMYERKDKQPVIFKTFEGLGSGETMELINDHDPLPLHDKFKAQLQDTFKWEYLEEGPELWRIAITKK